MSSKKFNFLVSEIVLTTIINKNKKMSNVGNSNGRVHSDFYTE